MPNEKVETIIERGKIKKEVKKIGRKIRKRLVYGMALALVVFLLCTGAGAQTWIELFPTGTPPTPRHSAGSAYDEVNDRLILIIGIYHLFL